jgi:hypothetical protein
MIYDARLGSIIMSSYDYIYGSRVIVQCKKRINPHQWQKDPIYSRYLKVIKKGDEFFDYWYRIKTNVHCRVRIPPNEIINPEIKQHVGTEIDDELKERNRVVFWSKDDPEIEVVPRGGHRGQSTSEVYAFCARDQGISIKLPKYTSV